MASVGLQEEQFEASVSTRFGTGFLKTKVTSVYNSLFRNMNIYYCLNTADPYRHSFECVVQILSPRKYDSPKYGVKQSWKTSKHYRLSLIEPTGSGRKYIITKLDLTLLCLILSPNTRETRDKYSLVCFSYVRVVLVRIVFYLSCLIFFTSQGKNLDV